jgi:hypothetical protein
VDNPTPQDFTHYVQALKQLKELTTVSNPWIPVWSAVIGGLIASIPTGIGALYRARSTQKSVETAISAEIENIASMIRKRNYLNLLKEIRSELIEINNQIASVHDNDETSPNVCSRAITVTISADYYKIYKANLDKLGIINNKKLLKIVNFYSHLESIMLDIKPEGNLGKGGSVEDYTEVIIFLEDALKLADELSTQTT